MGELHVGLDRDEVVVAALLRDCAMARKIEEADTLIAGTMQAADVVQHLPAKLLQVEVPDMTHVEPDLAQRLA